MLTMMQSFFFSSQEEQRRQQRKESRKRKKASVDADEDVDPNLAAMMGFAGFGSSKK